MLLIAITALLVAINGFFVAVEFALVKARRSRVEEQLAAGRSLAKPTLWLMHRLDRTLSACQLGITMASLGLGWVGEPAIARLLHPVFETVGITSAGAIHTLSFIIAFTIITALHLVAGEQAPKIFAIREPERVAMALALPLKWFYIAAYPLLYALDATTSALLRIFGVKGGAEHGTPHSEAELRALVSHSHAHGELTPSEHRLIDAVFEFDDTICRQIMVPRVDVVFIDAGTSVPDALEQARSAPYTRYPVCDRSLDHVIGVVHIKDLISNASSLADIMRAPRYVPETLPIKRLLTQFQASHEHMVFVVDEYGTVQGLITLEDVIEKLIGPIQDEFDAELPEIVSQGPRRFLIDGATSLSDVNRRLDLSLSSNEHDTIAGLLIERMGGVPQPNDEVTIDDVVLAATEVDQARVKRILLTHPVKSDDPAD